MVRESPRAASPHIPIPKRTPRQTDGCSCGMLLINLATIYQGGSSTLRHSQIQAEQLSRIQLRYTLTGEMDPLIAHMVNELRKTNTALPRATYIIFPSPHHTTLHRDSTFKEKTRETQPQTRPTRLATFMSKSAEKSRTRITTQHNHRQ